MAIDYAYRCNGTDTSNGGQLKFTGTLAFGTGDWTIEAFLKFDSSLFGGAQRDVDIFGLWDTVLSTKLSMSFNYPSANQTVINAAIFLAGGAVTTGLIAYSFVANRWYHVAYVRSGNTLSLYVNGSRISTLSIVSGTVTSATAWYVNGANPIGSSPTLSRHYIASHRVVIGTALYTGTTYTVPKATLTAVTGTVLLTGISSTIYDDGPSHFPITNTLTGTGYPVYVTTDGPFTDNIISETLTLSDTTTATLTNEGTLAQRFTRSGILQTPSIFDEYSVSNNSTTPELLSQLETLTSATAIYPSTISGTGLTYTGTLGIFTWTAPAGATKVSVVCIGGGGSAGYGGGASGGGGGGVGWKNNISVTPGVTYTVVAGRGGFEVYAGAGTGISGGDSYFINTSTVKGGGGGAGLAGVTGQTVAGGAGGTYTGDGGGTGGAGGSGTPSNTGAGGGAGGYTGTGGAGSNGPVNTSSAGSTAGGNPATGSGGAGGGSNGYDGLYANPYAAGGGGVGLFGKGSDGAGGIKPTSGAYASGYGGTGGSGGSDGSRATGALAPYGGLDGTGRGGIGGGYGGGSGAGQSGSGAGGVGAVRIIWGGSNRSFPTNAGTNTYTPNSSNQKLWPDGTFQIAGTFDEVSLKSDGSFATYPSTTSGTGLTYSGTPGTFTWTCPTGVTKVSVVCVGGGGGGGGNGGGGGGGAALAYINNYSVTPGTTYTVVAGNGAAGGTRTAGGTSYFNNTSTVAAGGGGGGLEWIVGSAGGAGGTVLAGTGFPGGAGGQGDPTIQWAGGGGAGGYTGAGGNGSSRTGVAGSGIMSAPTASTGGGGGGGYSGATAVGNYGGGGVGLLGPGTNGAAGGFGGSGGGNGGNAYSADTGGLYGGGAGGSGSAAGGVGAVRIYWGSGGTTLAPTVKKQSTSSYQVYDSIDEVSLAYSITPDKTLVNEGDTVTYTINAPMSKSSTLYYTNVGSTAAADFSGGLVYGVTPLTWAGTATATLWSFTGITQLSTSGFGTGAVFSIRKNNATTTMATHGVLTVIPTSPGSGYQIGDTIVIDGASLGLTTTTNNLTITVGSDWFAQGVYPSTVTGTGLGTMATGAANWTCPDGVYRISVVCVGGGGGGETSGPHGGGGGALAYAKDIAVVPGTVYPIQVGIGGAGGVTATAGSNGGPTYWNDGSIVYAGGGSGGSNGGYGGTVAAGTGYPGGAGGFPATAPYGNGGGGAGGYTSAGGAGGLWSGNITQSGSNSISGGGGGSTGGGLGSYNQDGTVNNTSTGNGGGGGGVGLLGVSNLGLGGVNLPGSSGAILGQLGYGGSGGASGGNATTTVGGAGGAYGGGGGGGQGTGGGAGGAGALRMIWNYPHGFLPSTTALTSVDNTKLLTAQSATITDATGLNIVGNIATVTAGNVTIPFAGTYSNQFNGTTQYLVVPSSSNFVFGASDDFTIEGYLYTSATTINKGLIYKRAGSNFSGVNFGTSTTTASRFTLKVANADGTAWTVNDETAGTFAINTWYHFAITKTNGVIHLYINGLLIRQYAHTTAIYDDGSTLFIGRDPGGSFWVGYLSNIRIIKGTALYYPPSTIVSRNYPDYPSVVQNSGPITITNGTATLALPVGQDILQEGVQDIQLQLRSGSTSGTLLATAPTVVVADTSRPLALPGGGQCMCAYPDYVSGPNLVYTGTPGVFTFTAPKGYTAVSAVAIGAGGGGGYNGGGGGGGGALSYSASIAVTAGTTYTITCGAPGAYGGGGSSAGGASSFASTIIANGGQPGGTNAAPAGGAGGTVGAGTGFAGGAGGTGVGTYSGGGGGGAGGYTVAGGVGGSVTGTYPTITAGSGAASTSGGAGGSAGGSATAGAYTGQGGGGGGTSPFGSVAVASIAGTSLAGLQSSPGRGGGGSGGVATTTAFGVQLGERGYTATPYPNGANQPPHGGKFGGGGGAGDGGASPGGNGGPGCVRIIWGTGRAYPATLTADRVSGYPAAVGNPAGQQ
jgi:Concanavalin A-like lectin/glucanases superfamily